MLSRPLFHDRWRRKLSDVSERHLGLICLVVYLGASAWRIQSFIFEGRFWAEEGQVFFPALEAGSVLGVFTFLFNGHLELFTNLTIWIGTRVPLRYAPLATTHITLLFQLIPLWFLLKVRRDLGLGAGRCILLTALAATIPQGVEIWANAINLHFHFALLAVLILLAPHNPGRSAILSCSLLFGCGLSGIPTGFLTPWFALKALRSRVRVHLLHFVVMLCTSSLQLFLLWSHPGALEARVLELDLKSTVLAYLAHVVVWPTLPDALAERVSAAMLGLGTSLSPDRALLTVVFVLFVLLLIEIVRRGSAASRTCLALSVYLAGWLVAASLGDKTLMVISGSRYLYVSVLLILAAIVVTPLRTLRLGWLLVALTLLQGPKNTASQFSGPDWSDSLEQAQREGQSTVAIWPNGWLLPIPASKER